MLEIVGVAGAGKSTAARLLCSHPGFRPAGFIHARRPSHLFQVLRSVPRLRRILAEGMLRTPRISWREIKLLAYVERWSAVLSRQAAEGAEGAEVLVFDQGPVYALVRLTAESKPFTHHPSFGRWQRELLQRWGERLDVVAVLDASDDALWGRINTRDQQHAEKGNVDSAGKAFLQRYRATFERLLGCLDDARGPTIVRIDTAISSPDDVVQTLIRAIEADRIRTSTGPRESERAR
jgi:adenylate kinase family enzyme